MCTAPESIYKDTLWLACVGATCGSAALRTRAMHPPGDVQWLQKTEKPNIVLIVSKSLVGATPARLMWRWSHTCAIDRSHCLEDGSWNIMSSTYG